MAKLKGRGVAAVNYPTGMNLGGDPSQALIHATTTGSFVVTLSSVDLGQGGNRHCENRCRKTLGIPRQVRCTAVRHGPPLHGTFASRAPTASAMR